MHKIHKLSTHEAQKIAAGEVIERPANLLKELIENAIDAHSTKIQIHVQDGGKKLIRVVDNGCGMSPEDAQICFEQHATSKITSVDHLHEIATFGFRGEALSSIAAVAKTTLITKEDVAEHGTRLTVAQNRIEDKNAISAVKGTDITVEHLFYNLPARKKFLKKRETEWRQIQQLFCAIAMAHLNIDFKVYAEDKLLFNCPATDNLQTRWQQLFDYAKAQHMLKAERRTPDVTITGIVSDHHFQRYDRGGIYLFVNNRWVKDNALTRAFIKGYQNVLPPMRYPAGCLFICVDPQQVDINIHPRKEEVQFLHPRRVNRALQTCITQALETHLSAQLQQSVSLKKTAPPDTSLPTPVHQPIAPTHSFSPFNFDQFLHTPAFNDEPTTATTGNDQKHTHVTDTSGGQPAQTDNASAHMLSKAPTAEPSAQEKSTHTDAQQKSFIAHKQQVSYELIGQYKKTYLLLEQEDGLLLIDQHAAHERILYEQFVAQHGQSATVALLFSQVITLSKHEVTTVTKYVDLFAHYGIELEPFGQDKIQIRATPVSLKNVALDEIIQQAIGWIDELQGLDQEQFDQALQKRLYADMACKAAVKAGDTLSHEQMLKLLKDLDQTERRFSCPHGRPTSWRLHHDEIKKKFKRDYRSQQPVE